MHRFYGQKNNKAAYFTSIAKFTHVWLLENKVWKLSRSLSFDHNIKDTAIQENLLFVDTHETQRWIQQNGVPALGIGFIENGILQETTVYGNFKNGNTATKNALFNVASLTKPITAMVALKLASRGDWNIDMPIYTYFNDPDIKDDPRSKMLTTRHILSHQTGFPNWRWNTEKGTLGFEFDPGTKYQYSGEGFEILRKALENKFKKDLNELATALIFEPLKMKNSNLFWANNTNDAFFVGNFDTSGNAYNLNKYTTPNGADDLLTTVKDYSNFLLSIINKDGFSENVFAEMVRPHVQTKKGKYFGLGFEIYHFKDGTYALSHGGSDKGVQTLVFVFPETKEGLVIFTNVDEGYKVFSKTISHYLGDYAKEIIAIETGK